MILMRALCTVLITLCVTAAPWLRAQDSDAAQATDPTKIADYLKTLPAANPPEYTEVQRLALAANPIGCEDHPHAPRLGVADDPRQAYLWQPQGSQQILEDYPRHRAFYGCLDWHSAVNSTWMMVSLIKSDPTIEVAPAIRLELESHIQKSNIDGELAYFKDLKGREADFEKPYGYAWLIKLYGEAKTWDDPEGKRVALTLEPLAKWMTEQYILYLRSLNYPVRVGLHPNTALDMNFVLDSTNETHDTATQAVIHDTALRLFGKDQDCATASEPVFGTFASPCLAEAALMGRVLDPAAYSKWLDAFLPPVYSDLFQGYAKSIDDMHGDNVDQTGTDAEGLPNAHLVGLNYQRAADFEMIANGLPKDDPRVSVYRRLANISANQGYAKIGTAGYLGTHWIATYALMYENLANAPAAPSQTMHAAAGKK
jgi:hypothetical protein